MTKPRKQGNTSAFDRKLSLSGVRRQIIIKEEGSKEDDRQGDDFFVAVKNVYVDLKLYHQKDENQKHNLPT